MALLMNKSAEDRQALRLVISRGLRAGIGFDRLFGDALLPQLLAPLPDWLAFADLQEFAFMTQIGADGPEARSPS